MQSCVTILVFFTLPFLPDLHADDEDEIQHLVPPRSAILSPSIYEGELLGLREILEIGVPPRSVITILNFDIETRLGMYFTAYRVVRGDYFSDITIKVGAFESIDSDYDSEFKELKNKSFVISNAQGLELIKCFEQFLFDTRQVPKGKIFQPSVRHRFFGVYVEGRGEIHGAFPAADRVSVQLEALRYFSDWFMEGIHGVVDAGTESKFTEDSVEEAIERLTTIVTDPSP